MHHLSFLGRSSRLWFATVGLIIWGIPDLSPASPLTYAVIKKLPVTGDGEWDSLTLDPHTRRLYISHETRVQILDIDSYGMVAEIPDTPGVHGIALAPEHGKGYISNGEEGTVAVFDLYTHKMLNRIKVGGKPDAILYDPSTARVFVMNRKSLNATAIDAAFGKIAGRISLGGRPDFAVADGSGTLYVNIEDRGQLMKLDARRLRVKKHWALSGCFGPSSMAMDRTSGRLFIGCHNEKLVVVNTETGKIVQTLRVGKGVGTTVFDPESRNIFHSSGEGTISVFHQDSPNKYHLVETIPTQLGARSMALDPNTQRFFLTTAQRGPTPTPTASNPRTRAPVVPGTFTLIVVGPTSPLSRPPANKTVPLQQAPTWQIFQ